MQFQLTDNLEKKQMIVQQKYFFNHITTSAATIPILFLSLKKKRNLKLTHSHNNSVKEKNRIEEKEEKQK